MTLMLALLAPRLHNSCIRAWIPFVTDNKYDFFTYIVRCADDTLYTGWTNNLEQRLKAHNSGCGAKYTRTRAPVTLIASWGFDSKSEAMRLEYAIKQMPRQAKLKFIESKTF